MCRVRMRFSKTGSLRFIGHLDFLRVFQQTIRRAGLPAAFSQGFNPHLQISFALPLPLGMESVNDYADLTLTEELSPAEIVEKLNAVAPSGLLVKAAYAAENKAASVVSVADYILNIPVISPEEILQQDKIIIAKKTKKGIKDTDIRPDILSLELQGSAVLMRLSAGSSRFLNPVTVAELIAVEGEKPSVANISRIELYQENENGKIITL